MSCPNDTQAGRAPDQLPGSNGLSRLVAVRQLLLSFHRTGQTSHDITHDNDPYDGNHDHIHVAPPHRRLASAIPKCSAAWSAHESLRPAEVWIVCSTISSCHTAQIAGDSNFGRTAQSGDEMRRSGGERACYRSLFGPWQQLAGSGLQGMSGLVPLMLRSSRLGDRSPIRHAAVRQAHLRQQRSGLLRPRAIRRRYVL
jgi:hypothetical protein